MDTTSIFNFTFVDRSDERRIFSNYNRAETIGTILWVTGKRGVGKTRFIKQMIESNSEQKIIWLDNSIQDTQVNDIYPFLKELQKLHNSNFYDYVKKNYQLFLDLGKDVISALLGDKNNFLSHLSKYLFKIASNTFEENNSQKDNYLILTSYLDSVLNDASLFVVLDNFSRFNKISSRFYMDIIKNYINSTGIKFCIITTDEDMELNKDLENDLLRNIPFKNIAIEEFSSYVFFAEILFRIFGDAIFSYDDVKYIYSKCSGNPENLIKIMKKSLKRQAINITDSAITINKIILYDILKNENVRFSKDDFTFIEELLLIVIVSIGKSINAKLLMLIIEFLASKIFLYKQFTEQIFFETLGTLINNKVLIYGTNDTLVFEHDSDFLDIRNILYDLNMKPQICYYLYEFISTEDLTVFGYTHDNREYYKAYYACEACIPGWEQINLQYGKLLYDSQRYHEGTLIFDKLKPTKERYSAQELFMIAITYYQDGQYQKCFTLLNIIDNKMIHSNDFQYQFYFMLGKTENIINKKRLSIKHLKEALNYIKKTSPEYTETLNLLHLTFMETHNGYESSKRIFEYVKDNFKEITPFQWAQTIRGAANFYDGNEALGLLNEALTIADQENRNIEIAYLKNSIGFIELRNGNIDLAKENFRESYDLLRIYKIHEVSYALNNLAICKMLQQDYENALTDLLNALLWNCIPYAYYTINCHLLICYVFLKQLEEARKIIRKLEKYVFKNTVEDPVILRKIKMNIGIAHILMKEPISGQNWFKSITPDMIYGTSSEFRYRLYTGQLDGYMINRDNIYFKCQNFEPWVLIYGHD